MPLYSHLLSPVRNFVKVAAVALIPLLKDTITILLKKSFWLPERFRFLQRSFLSLFSLYFSPFFRFFYFPTAADLLPKTKSLF